jgi:hypothetical protein
VSGRYVKRESKVMTEVARIVQKEFAKEIPLASRSYRQQSPSPSSYRLRVEASLLAYWREMLTEFVISPKSNFLMTLSR